MAGHNDHSLIHDPAIDRWATMRETTYQHFRWTRRTVSLSVLYLVAIPVGLTYLAYKTHDKDFEGKGNGFTWRRDVPEKKQ
ncbi:hypothetical protein K493DRAFT_261802 [Basidiobolus meristosporus CBS 931.73]|uniref:NADH dehydrogenase [ubiquinone] 1 beta subcomplex subunit 4 n=1 Tax=Basidiobolus meristosporus CBS 931.73 TaxID=1314790 RepID=A0A1Y1Y924_9FUNG|nr:hypothetical protein K493DRAFT_261802 [Basidiobolus meristosporus CBS 931.73]|eukprot:ORX94054.1 hypothetical protein K493DRAFT_261802 [Basidiobolus meristosporus CBS 931.73]